MKFKYEDAVKELHSSGMFRIELGLDRIKTVLKALGNPQDKLQFIHVAGTNGKGSVCAICESVLREAGYKTGLYTSPHVFEYTERIKISGESISKETFAKYFSYVYKKLQETKVDLTEFEILTVMMFLIFKDSNVEVVMLETGMGGRFDATNVIKENLCSIITQIDLDHTDRLGDTKEKIAFEKAGIIKQNCPVFTSMGYEVIKDKADECNSPLIFVSPSVNQVYVDALAIKGIQQNDNLALALSAINYLFPNISESTVIMGLRKVKHPFRFEYFPKKNLIVDVAHNPNGVSILRENLDLYYPNSERRFVFGCLRTKDYKKMMNLLFREGDEVFLYEFDYPNACSYEELYSNCPAKAQKFYPDSTKLNPDKLNIVCGSFYYLKSLNLF